MRAIQIRTDTIDKILAGKPKDLNREALEDFAKDICYFIPNWNWNEELVKTDWCIVQGRTMNERFKIASREDAFKIAYDWADVTLREVERYEAMEIRNMLHYSIASMMYSSKNDGDFVPFETAKGCFIVFNYPTQGEYTFVDPKNWDDSDFYLIETGPTIQLKSFLKEK